ncbi:MAG: F0F1 ATP synthase subunit epsilon [Bacteroidota bacterium]
MHITVLTPDKNVFKGDITSVKVPGTNGQFQVLKNHAPIVSSLEAGEIFIVTAGGEYSFFNEESGSIEKGTESGRTITFKIGGGFIEVLNNEVSLLVQGIR